MRDLLFFLFAAALFGACNNSQSTENEQSADPVEEEMAPVSITIEEKKRGIDYQNAILNSFDYKDGKFSYKYDTSTYRLGYQTLDATSTMCANSDQGQHIHLIIDNEPYIAKYTAEFDQEVTDGDHDVLTFLSRSYHESIKKSEAHKAEHVTVSNGSITKRSKITEPMLFYSRPKGNYVGKDTKEILLDFYPVNAPLGENYKVKADINGKEFTIDNWQPYIIKGLPMGENSVTLTLIDGEGKAVAAPHNPVTRKFTLTPDPLEN